MEELRELAASTIKSNSDDFVGFLESDIDTYCHKVQIIDFWILLTYSVLFSWSMKMYGAAKSKSLPYRVH